MPNSTPIPKKGPSNKFMRSINKLGDINLLSIFDPPKRKPAPRTVLVNVPLPPHASRTAPVVPLWKVKGTSKAGDGESENEIVTPSRWVGLGSKIVPTEGWIFESNQVLTSKYNILTFLPRNLLEQFRRVANIFFLVLVILQFFSLFSTVSPFLAALPLIVVLAISGIKDGYEDLKRHQSDRSINSIKVHTLRGQFHNPNTSRSKSRSFGLPNFLTNFFLKRALEKEEEETDEERDEERKKGFWGKRKVRRPTIQGKKRRASFNELESPRDNPEDTSPSSAPRREQNGTAVVPEPLPEKITRLEGDYYADDGVEPVHGGDHQLGKLIHLPDAGQNYDHFSDKALWVNENWEDLKVGDFVRLRGDESVPADMVICATSEEENVCYVETKNLDGETNLKSRQAVPELTHLRTSTLIATEAKFTVESEPADVNMFHYTAAVVLHDGRLDKKGKPLRCPVTLNTVLLRGTVVRNTDWVIGVIVMTGRDTKIVLNTGGTPSKRSKVERQMNPMVLVNLLLLALMSIMCGVVNHALEVTQARQGVYWIYNSDGSSTVPPVNGLITFANALITFQNIVPISLYISIEFVRLLQAYFIWADNDIMYRSGLTKRRTTARSWNLSDDLGQIEYIFSDKTGTLTQNVMLFRQCSVGGKVYSGTGSPSGDSTAKDESLNGTTRANSGQSAPSSSEDMEKGKAANLDNGKKAPAPSPSFFRDNQVDSDLAKRDSTQGMNLYAFFCNLALCHTVLASEEDGLIAYKAQSPDEAALVQAAADVGFVFLGRDKDILRLQTPHDQDVVEFQFLDVLDFTSVRKRMSVILRRVDDGSLVLLSKGADNVIYERLAPGDEDLKKTTDSHLEEFANEGLRTLCLAYKPLDEEEYEAWEAKFQEAATLIEGREEAIERISNEIEQNLILLGATAIEDRLQDGVPEAIADLKRAGLKIWVATGDKLETAIAIGKTCNLLSRDMNVIIIRGGAYGEPNSAYSQLKNSIEKFFSVGGLVQKLQNQPPDADQLPHSPRRSGSLRRLHRTISGVSGVSDIVGEDNGTRPGGYGLVIDGASLGHAFAEPYTKDLLLELATRCRAVICCRTSPLQKALMVRLVKDGLGAMCLAIGDGANDVSMIQAADIGVGVAGEEGLQAVNSSDYAIGQFRYLQRLLLVHGHWSYMRNSTLIVNFFYKEIIGVGILFWFQFFCNYSSTTVYEYTYLLFWNVFWTLTPVIAIGVFDRNVEDKVLMAVPELYKIGSGGQLFGLFRFSVYMFDGVYQSVIIYFFLAYAYDTTTARSDGYSIALYEFSTVMAIAAVLAANMYTGLNTRSWNWWVFGGVLLGPVLILGYTAVYSAFKPSLLWTYVYGNNAFLWPSAYFWFGMLFTIFLSLLPRYLYRFYSENYYQTDIDILAWTSKNDPNHDWVNDPFMPQPLAPAQFEKEPSLDQAPVFNTAGFSPSRPSYDNRQDSFQLGRVMTSASITHDMSTGSRQEGAGRGYGFDQADGMQPPEISRYASRTSENSASRARPRKGSIRLGALELNLNPFRSPTGRARSGSMRQALFGNRKSVIDEGSEPPMPTSPTKQGRRGRGKSGGDASGGGAVPEQAGPDADI